MIKWRRDEKGLKILHFHLYGHFKSTWQVAKCCCKEIRHQQMTNPYDVYEKSTYRKVSQMRGWDSGGDFAVSFGCESCFSSETQSFCVAQSKSVPNMVVIMRIFRKKWLRSSIGRSQGVRIPASLSEWGGEPVYSLSIWKESVALSTTLSSLCFLLAGGVFMFSAAWNKFVHDDRLVSLLYINTSNNPNICLICLDDDFKCWWYMK